MTENLTKNPDQIQIPSEIKDFDLKNQRKLFECIKIFQKKNRLDQICATIEEVGYSALSALDKRFARKISKRHGIVEEKKGGDETKNAEAKKDKIKKIEFGKAITKENEGEVLAALQNERNFCKKQFSEKRERLGLSENLFAGFEKPEETKKLKTAFLRKSTRTEVKNANKSLMGAIKELSPEEQEKLEKYIDCALEANQKFEEMRKGGSKEAWEIAKDEVKQNQFDSKFTQTYKLNSQIKPCQEAKKILEEIKQTRKVENDEKFKQAIVNLSSQQKSFLLDFVESSHERDEFEKLAQTNPKSGNFDAVLFREILMRNQIAFFAPDDSYSFGGALSRLEEILDAKKTILKKNLGKDSTLLPSLDNPEQLELIYEILAHLNIPRKEIKDEIPAEFIPENTPAETGRIRAFLERFFLLLILVGTASGIVREIQKIYEELGLFDEENRLTTQADFSTQKRDEVEKIIASVQTAAKTKKGIVAAEKPRPVEVAEKEVLPHLRKFFGRSYNTSPDGRDGFAQPGPDGLFKTLNNLTGEIEASLEPPVCATIVKKDWEFRGVVFPKSNDPFEFQRTTNLIKLAQNSPQLMSFPLSGEFEHGKKFEWEGPKCQVGDAIAAHHEKGGWHIATISAVDEAGRPTKVIQASGVEKVGEANFAEGPSLGIDIHGKERFSSFFTKKGPYKLVALIRLRAIPPNHLADNSAKKQFQRGQLHSDAAKQTLRQRG